MELTQRQPTGGDWRRWLTTRQGTVVIALVSALLAAGIIVYALREYRHSVSTGGQRETVLVAAQAIEKGTSGDAIGVGQLFRTMTISAKQALPGVITDPSVLQNKVATANIYAGSQLTAADFTTASSEFVTKLAKTQRALSVPLEGAHGLIGNVHVGDHVDVYASFPERAGSPPVLRLLAPNVEILNAGQLTSGSGLASNQANAVNNVILEVNTRQAAKIAFAVDNGKIWLTLRPGNGGSPQDQAVTLSSILAGNPVSTQEGKQ
jgi:Flp pilus assembly protein CpaB